jgi:hypothetical protein
VFADNEPDPDTNIYRQCTLVRDGSYQMSWLPARFANVTQVLKLRKPDGTWENGWMVLAVHGETTGVVLSSIDRMFRRFAKLLRHDGGSMR